MKCNPVIYNVKLINNVEIERVTDLKHLEITLERHINLKCTELGKQLNISRRLPIYMYITPITKLKIYTTSNGPDPV